MKSAWAFSTLQCAMPIGNMFNANQEKIILKITKEKPSLLKTRQTQQPPPQHNFPRKERQHVFQKTPMAQGSLSVLQGTLCSEPSREAKRAHGDATSAPEPFLNLHFH